MIYLLKTIRLGVFIGSPILFFWGVFLLYSEKYTLFAIIFILFLAVVTLPVFLKVVLRNNSDL